MAWARCEFTVVISPGYLSEDDGRRKGWTDGLFTIHKGHKCYMLSHKASGLRIHEYDTKQLAEAAALRFSTLRHIDWSKPEPCKGLTYAQMEPMRLLA